MNPKNPLLVLLLIAAASAPLSAAQLVVTAADFHSMNEAGHNFDNAGGWIEGRFDPGNGCLVAGVDLPRNALVKSIQFQLYDNRSDDFWVSLRRKRLFNSVPAEFVTGVFTSGASTSIQQPSVSLPQPGHQIDPLYVYFLHACLEGNGHRINAVRINYLDALIFADGFESGDTAAWGAPFVQPPQPLRLSGADFLDSYSNYWPWFFDSELAAFGTPNDDPLPTPCGFAPIELPQGATITGLVAYLYDILNARDLTLSLRRSPMSSRVASSVLASVSTSGASGWQVKADFSIDDPLIANQSYWYWVDVCVTGGDTSNPLELLTQAVEVTYTLP